ncbi:MAG: hypothetical protein AAFY59_08485 [Pseudomonadota bacterium]
MLQGIVAAYRDVPGTFARRLKAPPGEPRLMMYAFLIGLVGFLAGLPGTLAEARTAIAATGEGDLSSHVMAALFGAIFLFPLFLYGLAALVRVISRMFGGRGSGEVTRHAVFWGMLLGTPLAALGTLVGGTGSALFVFGLNILLFIAFIWILAGTVMVAERFESRLRVMLGFFVPSLFFFGLVLLSSPSG